MTSAVIHTRQFSKSFRLNMYCAVKLSAVVTLSPSGAALSVKRRKIVANKAVAATVPTPSRIPVRAVDLLMGSSV